MRYLSLFSGIEAATVAWHPLGWTPVAFAEVSPFGCAVLSYHYPQVPNLGDVTRITEHQIQDLGRIDVVVFGSPCQDLSVAGRRAGLKGKRSGLFFDAMRIVRWSGARYALFENVPGLFSSHDGGDFAAVVGAMAGMEFDVPPDGWRNTGVALGRDGLVEWSVLDAQFFGVPQRRRRVFALRDIGDWRSRPPLLFIAESLRGYPAPSREAGKRTSPTLEGRAGRSGCNNFATSGGLVARRLRARANATHREDSDNYVAMCLNGKGGSGRIDGESETFVTPTLRAGKNSTGGDRPSGTDVDTCDSLVVTHSLRAEGFDASEDGTGRGIPLVAASLNGNSGRCQIEQQYIPILEVHGGSSSRDEGPNGIGIGESGDPMFTLQSGKQHAVAFSCKDHGQDVGKTAPTLRSMGFDKSHANAGGQVAVAFGISNQPTPKFGSDVMPTLNGHCSGGRNDAVAFDTTQVTSKANYSNPKPGDPCHPLASGAHPPAITGSAVRRLTPEECESLQGFNRGYTLVPYRGKPAADGPRYAAIGNSMAVPVMHWIGERIDMIESRGLAHLEATA